MKKIFLLLFSLILPFSSYGEWVGFVTDANKNIHYVDFDEMTKNDGYIYYWEMTNYANPTDRFLSIATYHKADCCLLYTSPSPRDAHESRMPSSA